VAEKSKARVYGRLLAGIAGSIPVRGMDVCVVCVVQYGPKKGAKARKIRTKKYA
jgi:hypothetical protein